MPKQLVWSVHQRSTITSGLERELACFTDDMMADQAIHHLYRYAWDDISKGTASLLWFNPAHWDDIKVDGIDKWETDDKNSLTPVFFKRPHELWNQVPPNADELRFKQEVFDLGNVAVVEVKKTF